MKCRDKDKKKLYKIYLRCRTHHWPVRTFSDFVSNMWKFNSIIEICETDTYTRKKPFVQILNKEQYNQIEKYYDQWYDLKYISNETWFSVYKIKKYFIPKKELENLF